MIPVWITTLFQLITEGFKFGQKVTPPDEIRIDRHEIKKPKLEAGIWKAILRQAKHYFWLPKNKKESIDNHVELVYGHLNEEDKAELKQALHEAYPKHK